MYLPNVLCQFLALNLGLSHAKLVREALYLTWDYGSPNGAEPRQMVFTNGAYPGPDLVWDEDDDIEVTHTHTDDVSRSNGLLANRTIGRSREPPTLQYDRSLAWPRVRLPRPWSFYQGS